MLSLTTGRTDTLFVDREREIPFPVGQTVAVGSRGPRDPIGVTPPFDVRQGDRIRVPSFHVTPPGHADVMLSFQRPSAMTEGEFEQLKVIFHGGGAPVDASRSTVKDRPYHYSLFYDVAAGHYEALLGSALWRMSPSGIDVGTAPILILENLAVLPAPSLEIALRGAASKVKVRLFECSGQGFGEGLGVWPDLRSCDLYKEAETRGPSVSLPGIRAAWNFLVLETEGRRVGRELDFRHGDDRSETFSLGKLHLTGRVIANERGVPAGLSFEDYSGLSQTVSASADDEGEFHASLWGDTFFRVTVKPRTGDPATFLLGTRTHSGEDMTHDFVLPTTRIEVHVTDEKTGAPVSGAALGYVVAGSSDETTADDTGEATLPAQEPGLFEFGVSAAGYKSAKASLDVLPGRDSQRVDVALSPLDPAHTIRVLLPDGSPASGAGLFYGPNAINRFSCDADGLCQLAERPADDELLFVVHPKAGLTIERAADALAAGTVSLLPAGGVLRLLPKRRSGVGDGPLHLVVMVAGVAVPDFVLAAIANMISQPYRNSIRQPGPADFVVLGLPAGEIGVVITGVGSNSAAPLSDPMMVRLPQGGPEEIDLR